MRLAGRRRTGLALTELAAIVAVATAAGFAAPASAQATTYPDAVVLVSGFNTNSPFTTPDPACNGREGEVWNPPTGPAGALKARGFAVFTAPVRHLQDPEAPACSATGAALPPQSQYIDSGGDIEANGVALAGFLAFLRDSYGVRRVHLVAHSDGGNWSRSALARSDAFAGVTVASLTTLGTPYNGSFLADLAFEIQGAGCDLPNPIERDLCKALGDVVDLIVADEGEIATRQLTRSFLVSWNRTQQIGSCPVTTIAGTYFDIPFFDLHYYDPADGYVGEASALAHRSYDIAGHPIPAPTIPGLRSGGTFPVVHAASLSFIDPDNLLNQQVISNQVAAIVAGTPPGGPACNAPGASLASASQRTVPPAARAAGRRAIRLR